MKDVLDNLVVEQLLKPICCSVSCVWEKNSLGEPKQSHLLLLPLKLGLIFGTQLHFDAKRNGFLDYSQTKEWSTTFIIGRLWGGRKCWKKERQLLLTAAVPFVGAHSSQGCTATSCLGCATAIPTRHHVSCGRFMARLKTPCKNASQHVQRWIVAWSARDTAAATKIKRVIFYLKIY